MNNDIKFEQILADGSTIDEKIKVLEKGEYFSKPKWNNNTTYVTLEEEALRTMLRGFNPIRDYQNISCDYTIGNRFGRRIITSLFRYSNVNMLCLPEEANDICAVVYNIPNMKKEKSSNPRANFYSASGYLMKNAVHPENQHFTQIFRYDAQSKNMHRNSLQVEVTEHERTSLKPIYKKDIMNVYKMYIEKNATGPHFHFFNARKRNSNSNRLLLVDNAITLNSLHTYLNDLNENNYVATREYTSRMEILNKNSFGMPFLAIKKSPNLYRSAWQRECVRFSGYQYPNMPDMDIFGYEPITKPTNGLDGVIADIEELSRIHNSQNYTGKDYLGELKLASHIAGFEPKLEL